MADTHMFVCTSCQGDACEYGRNRRGERTTTCCACARSQGWSSFVVLACQECRNAQADLDRNAQAPVLVGSVEDAPNAGCKSIASVVLTTGDFAHEVREMRRKRTLQTLTREVTGFKEAYDMLRFKRLHDRVDPRADSDVCRASSSAATAAKRPKGLAIDLSHRALQPIEYNSPRAMRCC